MSLVGTNVLVTRPEGQGEGLVEAIQAQGGSAWHYPVLVISGLDSDSEKDRDIAGACKRQIMDLDHFHHVIFISTNAVNFGIDWIDQYWAQLPIGLSWYGIGKATNTVLREAGIPVDSTMVDDTAMAAMNSEELMNHPNLQKLEHQKVLIVRGVGGRDYLEQHLQKRGAEVHYAECYRRLNIDKPSGDLAATLDHHCINAVCVNSGESVASLCQLAGEGSIATLNRLTLVVPGRRVAGIAKNRGFEDIVVAENASDSAMLAALLSAAVGVN